MGERCTTSGVEARRNNNSVQAPRQQSHPQTEAVSRHTYTQAEPLCLVKHWTRLPSLLFFFLLVHLPIIHMVSKPCDSISIHHNPLPSFYRCGPCPPLLFLVLEESWGLDSPRMFSPHRS